MTFSCETRGSCPSCHAKRREEWGQWVQATLLLDVPHRQVVLTIPKTLTVYLELIARVTSHIPDKGQVMVRYYGLYASAHRGKVRKANRIPDVPGLIEEDPAPLPSKGWAAPAPKRRIGLRSAEMICKVYEVDPMICPRCGGKMRVVAFLTEYAVVDRIIRHLELTFVAEKSPPAHVFEQTALMAAASQHS